MRNKTFKCSKLLLYFKKNQVNMVKNVKNCSKSLIMWKLHIFSIFLRFSQCWRSGSADPGSGSAYFYRDSDPGSAICAKNSADLQHWFFTMLNWIFLKSNKSLEHLNVLLCIFFVSGVFQNFAVDFWSLLKAEKVLAPKQFWRKIFFSFKILFSFIHLNL